MNEYILYKRRNLLRTGEIAWQIEGSTKKGAGQVIFCSSYKRPMDLEDFARYAAKSKSAPRITSEDRLTTIPAPVFVPTNEYVEEPVSGNGLVAFWNAYSDAGKKE
jgi:hypothetical protein